MNRLPYRFKTPGRSGTHHTESHNRLPVRGQRRSESFGMGDINLNVLLLFLQLYCMVSATTLGKPHCRHSVST